MSDPRNPRKPRCAHDRRVDKCGFCARDLEIIRLRARIQDLEAELAQFVLAEQWECGSCAYGAPAECTCPDLYIKREATDE